MTRLALMGVVLALAWPVVAREGRAVLILDPETGRGADAEALVRAVRGQVRGAWQVAPAEGLEVAAGDPACSEAAASQVAASCVAQIREASRLFFVEAEIERASELLERAVTQLMERPCLLARVGGAERGEAVAGAVLMVRLYLSEGRPEKASALARRLSLAFSRAEVGAVDVPPDVARFLEGIRADLEAVGATLTVSVLPEREAAAANVSVDGRVLEPPGPWSLAVAEGIHDVTVVGSSGRAVTRRVTTGEKPVRVEVDLVLAGAVETGPEGSLVLGPDVAGPLDVARRVAEVTGRTVLLARGEGGAVVVSALEPGGRVRPRLMVLERAGRGYDVVLARDAPFLERPGWPWPWVAGGAGLGLLGAGAVLNAMANAAAEAVNSGENRVSEHRAFKAASIACYVGAGAGLASAVVLYLVRPGPRTRIHLEPMAGGLGGAVTFR